MESVSALFPFALILVAFYFLIIRPSRARQRAAVALQERLAPGLEVLTTSGILGRVVSVDDDVVTIEVAPGAPVRFAKAAVARVLTEDGDGAHDGRRSDDAVEAPEREADGGPEGDRPAR